MNTYDEASKDIEIIEELLIKVELTQFLSRIRDELQVGVFGNEFFGNEFYLHYKNITFPFE